jgi:hypothetical protein
MTKSQRSRCQWRRFYKAVLLLHVDAAGERFTCLSCRRRATKEASGIKRRMSYERGQRPAGDEALALGPAGKKRAAAPF